MVRIEAGTVALDGQILARAEPNTFNSDRPGGAGGTIALSTSSLSGLGLIDASGASTAADLKSNHHVGAGGGGRIALYADMLDGFDPAPQTRAWGGSRQRDGTILGYAAAGTVLVAEGSGAGRLIIDNGAGRGAGATPLPALEAWPIVEVEVDSDDLWVASTAAFLPRWLGSWPELRDGSGGSLGSFRVGEIDAEGRVRLLGAGSVVGAAEIEGAYRFEAIVTPNGTVVTASDPVVVEN